MQEKIYVGSCPLESVQLRNASLPEQNEKHLPYMSIKLTLTLFREPPWTDQTIDDLPASFFFNDINPYLTRGVIRASFLKTAWMG